MANVVVVLILIILIGSACMYIYKSKKRGVNCIGCPYSQSCSGGCCEKNSSYAEEKTRKYEDIKDKKDIM